MLKSSPVMENLETDSQSELVRELNPAKKEPSSRRRSSRRSSGKRGKGWVLLLVFLILSVYGIRTYLFATGYTHPALTGLPQPEYTANLSNLIVTGIGLFCLFLLYRGVVALRILFGIVAIINCLMFAILITLGFIDGHHGMWLPFHAYAFFVSIYVTWACLVSRDAIHFINSQADRR